MIDITALTHSDIGKQVLYRSRNNTGIGKIEYFTKGWIHVRDNRTYEMFAVDADEVDWMPEPSRKKEGVLV